MPTQRVNASLPCVSVSSEHRGMVDFGQGVSCFSNMILSDPGCPVQSSLSICVARVILITPVRITPLIKMRTTAVMSLRLFFRYAAMAATSTFVVNNFVFTIVYPPLKYVKPN